MTLNEFTLKMYAMCKMNVKDYNNGNVLVRKVTPLTLDSITYKTLMGKEVMSYGMGYDEAMNEIIFEVQVKI